MTKGNWWKTFGTLFLLGIVVSIATYAFSMPMIIYTWMKMGVFSGEMDPTTIQNATKDPIVILLNVITIIAQYLLNGIFIVGIALAYFDLNEQKNNTGTLESIENIGETPQED